MVREKKKIFPVSNPNSFKRAILSSLISTQKPANSLSVCLIFFTHVCFYYIRKPQQQHRLSELLFLIFLKMYTYIIYLCPYFAYIKEFLYFISFVCWTLFWNGLIYIHFTVHPWISGFKILTKCRCLTLVIKKLNNLTILYIKIYVRHTCWCKLKFLVRRVNYPVQIIFYYYRATFCLFPLHNIWIMYISLY